MQKNIVVKQTGFKDCAVSCLLSIIRYYGGDISKEELSYIINTNNNGSSAYHMIEGMKKIGFDGCGFKKEAQKIFENNILCPFIAHVKNQNYYHFIVIYKINKKKKYLIVMDPSRGKLKISFDHFEKIYLNSILEFSKVNEIPHVSNKEKLLSFIYREIVLNKREIIKIFIFGIMSTFLTIISSLYYKIIIDINLKNQKIDLLIIIVIIFLVIILFKNILEYIKNKVLIKLKFNIDYNITTNVLRHILNLPYRYFKNKPTGEVISRINNLNDLTDFIKNMFLTFFINILLIIISLVILVFINLHLFLITLIFLLLYSFIVIIYSKILKKDVYELKESNDSYNQALTENIENYETIKNLNLIGNVYNKLSIWYIKFIRIMKKCENRIIKKSFLQDTLLDILNLLILSLGAFLIMNNKISLGDLILYITLMTFFIEPTKQVLNLILNYNYVISSYDRINDILLIKEEKINNMNKSIIEGNIKITNFSYSFDKVHELLNIKFLNIPYGSKYLIHGETGKGKSTLIKILLKYYEDYDGEIFISDKNIKDVKTESIRNSITYVSQNEELFSGTLKDNIILDRNVSEEFYEKIIKICKVDKIRDKKLFRDNFMIEDKGFNISGGEKQRIILARSLINNFNYLVLDECLSEVDINIEKEIIYDIFKCYKYKTIIYITHKEEIKKMFNLKYLC